MSRFGPIILIDDDADDGDIFEMVIRELKIPNELIRFEDCEQALSFLTETKLTPMIIFSDINLPGFNGLEFKAHIDSDQLLRKKSIPFVFYSTSDDQEIVNKAYMELNTQGFFKKGSDIQKIKQTIKLILEYWVECKHPNSDLL